MKNKFYRGLSKKSYTTEIVQHFKTQRAPSNIPYLVDNLWEWLRPLNMPSRRFSVYASPLKELAEKYALSSDLICLVELQGKSKAVQLTNYQDAKLHPDVRILQKTVLNYLGQDWLEADIENKALAGKLFIPLLSKDEIDDILDTAQMRDLKDIILKESQFWGDVSIINDETVLTDGELFFHSKDGYKLILED